MYVRVLMEKQVFLVVSKIAGRNLYSVTIEINRGGDIINYQKTVKEDIL